MDKKHNHYYKDVRTLDSIDVYRVLQLFNVGSPCIQHAVKKLLVTGNRGGGKDITQDLQEAIDSIQRALDMLTEDDISEEYADVMNSGIQTGSPATYEIMGYALYRWPMILKVLQDSFPVNGPIEFPNLDAVEDATNEKFKFLAQAIYIARNKFPDGVDKLQEPCTFEQWKEFERFMTTLPRMLEVEEAQFNLLKLKTGMDEVSRFYYGQPVVIEE